MGLKVIDLLRSVGDGKRNPEHYGGAGGELLVIAMLISWVLTYFFNYETIVENPLKDRVGYNNLCVGWDEPPARYVAAPIFALVIYFNVRFMSLDAVRAEITEDISEEQKKVTFIINLMVSISFAVASLIFVIRPSVSCSSGHQLVDGPKICYNWAPLWHTIAFVQLVIFQWFGYVANFYETAEDYIVPGSYIFLAFFFLVSLGFAVCALVQMLSYDPVSKTMGPIPWYITAATDYLWFGCMALQGHFRPRAPSLNVDYELTSDEDYSVHKKNIDAEQIGADDDAEEDRWQGGGWQGTPAPAYGYNSSPAAAGYSGFPQGTAATTWPSR